MKIVNSHDKFFKETFKRTENVKDLIRGIVDKDVLEKMDLASLKKNTGSYIDHTLKETFSDLVYTVMYRGSMTIKVALLFEHKSYKVEYPHFQLIQYMLNIWNADIRDHKKPMPVIPIIFYHGKETWEYRRLSNYFDGIDESFLKYIPNFDYVLFDLAHIDHDEIKNKLFHSIIGKMAMLVMKYIFDETELQRRITDIFEISERYQENENVIDFLESISLYIYTNTEIPKDFIIKEIGRKSIKGGELAMSTATKLIEQGKAEGQAEGEARGEARGEAKGLQEAFNRLIKKGVSVQKAKDLLGL